jgi:hypothetical protein
MPVASRHVVDHSDIFLEAISTFVLKLEFEEGSVGIALTGLSGYQKERMINKRPIGT